MLQLIIAIVILSTAALCHSTAKSVQHWTEPYNIEWTTPSKDVSGNMPVNAGDMACNVWVERKTGDLMFYIQRSGSFSEIGEHIKLGRIRVSLDPNPLKDCSEFSQRLILKDGYIAIRAIGSEPADFETRIKLWVDQYTHSVNVTIDTDKPISYTAAYESWRTEDYELIETPEEKAKNTIHTARWNSFSFCQYPGQVLKLKDTIKLKTDSVLFYHRNPTETMSPNLGIKQQGLEDYKDELTNVISNRTIGGRLFASNSVEAGTSEGRYYRNDFKSFILKSKAPKKKHHLYVVTHIQQCENIEEWLAELEATCETVQRTQGSFEQNKDWWRQFWDRSHIIVDPDNKDEASTIWQMGRNYNLMRYQLGGNAYGEFPTKFNGGNLTFDRWKPFDPDWRQWGGDFFTAQNQRLLYWPMLKAGDADMMHPQFELYLKALPGSKARVKESFGHAGAAFSENVDASGIHLPVTYGWNLKDHKYGRGEEIPFGDPRVVANVRAGSLVEKGVMSSSSVAYYNTLQLEFAYMIMERYRYTGESFERYIEFINESLVFFDEHYKIRKKMRDGTPLDENGKLVIYPSQACEAYKGVTNPVDVVAGLKACLNTLLSTDETYISPKEKEFYASFLKRIPDLPYGQIGGDRVMLPAKDKNPSKSSEAPQWYPLFPYNLFSILDDEISTFHNTWRLDHSMKRAPMGWNQCGIFAARMGLTQDALEYHRHKLADAEKLRYPTYWGPNYDGTPDHNHGGSAMIGLQEMLMQCFDEKILILPAWPKDIDVDFKLHAPHNTIVEVSYSGGQINKLNVTPNIRQKDLIIIPKDAY